MPFGGYRSNDPTPAYEIYFAVGAGYLAAAETQIYVGSYTMRFAGHLYVDLHAQLQWPGTSTLPDGASVYMQVGPASTPALGSNAQLGCHMDCPGAFAAEQEMRTHGAWYWLAAGQTVTVYAHLYTNITNSQVYVRYLGGNFRPTAT